MDRRALIRMIQEEIAALRNEETLLNPADLSPEQLAHHDMYLSKSSGCDHCGNDPCTCDAECSCRQDPCVCGAHAPQMPRVSKQRQHSLTCYECGGVMVMQEGCGCGGSSKMFEPLDIPMFDMQRMSTCPDCGMSPCQCEAEENHHRGAYMAHPQLHKIEKYARELQKMIPQDYDLDDWMRSHISQAADDLAEVYHKLEYKSHSDF